MIFFTMDFFYKINNKIESKERKFKQRWKAPQYSRLISKGRFATKRSLFDKNERVDATIKDR